MKTLLQEVVYYTNYARYNNDLKRRETWEETCQRVIAFFQKVVKDNKVVVTAEEWDAMYAAMLNQEALPSMRVVQMAGPALERCNVGAYNCAFLPIDHTRSFAELLYILMQGTGCGFSVESVHIDKLPTVMKQTGEAPGTLVVADSTEGWCEALRIGLEHWFNGKDIKFDYSEIRPAGTPLRTKGGRASGPEPLRQLLDYARKMLLNHQGRRLSSLNCHDLACFIGGIVQVGGVRRSAEISISEPGDEKMRRAKMGEFWSKAPERSMANNTAVYDSKPSMTEFFAEWQSLMLSGSGERGIFNREGYNLHQKPGRRAPHDQFGLNPCGEIVLRPNQFCNLSIAVARAEDGVDVLARKVKVAAMFGIIQSLLTDFRYLGPEWKYNCEAERLMGVDITGQCDNERFFLNGALYAKLKKMAVRTAHEMADRFRIARPTAVTTVKPSGNSSQLLNCSSGMHPRFAPFYIRRVRLATSNPVAQLLVAKGVPHAPEVGQPSENPSILVFEFPVKSPEGAEVRSARGAIRQLEQWHVCKVHYTEHNPSVTVYIKEDEWMKVGAWIYENWNDVGGISFLPHDGGVYNLAPYEEITEAEYDARMQTMPHVDFPSELPLYEFTDMTELQREYQCSGDRCEL